MENKKFFVFRGSSVVVQSSNNLAGKWTDTAMSLCDRNRQAKADVLK